ncbi:MAG: pseudouridine synthase [Actinomycetaceae bacterium]|nr:pseudouridine synthase [Actinomycetaceae bacterium]
MRDSKNSDRPAQNTAFEGEEHPEGQRLQKVLAHAGVGSRRACEALIVEGRVEVDGSIITELGARVGPDAVIYVDGQRVNTSPEHEVFAFHKPENVVSTMQPEGNLRCIGDYVHTREARLYHVGRLDVATSGLLLLTNYGELAHRLTHPSFEVPKTYVAMVQGKVAPGLGRKLIRGVELEDGFVTVDSFAIKELRPHSSIVELTLHSGRNRVVRRLLSAVGHPVTILTRTQVGPIRLDNLGEGKMRPINGKELSELLGAVGL